MFYGSPPLSIGWACLLVVCVLGLFHALGLCDCTLRYHLSTVCSPFFYLIGNFNLSVFVVYFFVWVFCLLLFPLFSVAYAGDGSFGSVLRDVFLSVSAAWVSSSYLVHGLVEFWCDCGPWRLTELARGLFNCAFCYSYAESIFDVEYGVFCVLVGVFPYLLS